MTIARSLAVVVLTLAPIPAQESESRTYTEDEIRQMIPRLGDRDPARVEAVVGDLVRAGRASIAPLRSLFNPNRSMLCFSTPYLEPARRALAICEVDAPISNGLKVGLGVTRAGVAPWEWTVLTITLCNVTEREIVVPSGISTAGNVFASGQAIYRVVPYGGQRERFVRTRLRGFCVNLLPFETTIPPLSVVRFRTDVVLVENPASGDGAGESGRHMKMGRGTLELDADGPIRVQLRYDVKPFGLSREDDREPEGAFRWSGELRSNVVELDGIVD